MSKAIEKAPIDCTNSELCRIPRDNSDCGDYWVLVDGDEVTLANQPDKSEPIDRISIPLKTFRKLVKFLTTPQKFIRSLP